MKEAKAQRESKRAVFRRNLTKFPNAVRLFGRSALEAAFRPSHYLQDTCLVHFFSIREAVPLQYLEEALGELDSNGMFRSKAKKLMHLPRTPDGFAEFNSVLIELWFAAQFAKRQLVVECEPATSDRHRGDFRVNIKGTMVYFEVRNLQDPGSVRARLVGPEQSRARVDKLQDIIRGSLFYQFPYPFFVNLEPLNTLGGDEDDFLAAAYSLVNELRDLLRSIHKEEVPIPDHPVLLPTTKPLVVVDCIRKVPGLSRSCIGFGEYTVNRLQNLASAAQEKIQSKAPQLATDAGNVLVVGLPIWAEPLPFAEELLGPLSATNQDILYANEARIDELGKKVGRSVSAFVLFQPADQVRFYPGWVQVVRNSLGWSRNPLPASVEEILSHLRT